MKVRLIHLPRSAPAHLFPRGPAINILPMGMLALADRLERAGHQVEVWHAGLEARLDPSFELAEALAQDGAELIGLSLHWHAQVAPVESAVAAIRARLPRAAIVLGGMTASWFPEEILRDITGVDFVLRGEAETPLALLAAALANGEGDYSSIPNLTWRRADRVVSNPSSYVADQAALDALDFARLDLLRHGRHYNAQFAPQAGRWGHPPVFYLCIGRGCSQACAFCGGGRGAHLAMANRTGVTFRSPVVVAGEMSRLSRRGMRDFCICFDPPPDSQAYYLALFEEVRRLHLEVGLVFECYQPPGPAFLEALARTFVPGLSRVSFSPTVGDEALRAKLLGFGYSNAGLESALTRCVDLGLATTLYFAAVPQESADQLESSLAWQARLRDRFRCRLVLSSIEAEPGAPWCLAPEAFGLRGVRQGWSALRARHARLGLGLSAADEVGYEFPGLDTRLVRARSVLGAPLRDLAQALGGCGLGTGERLLLVGPERLDEGLDLAAEWRGMPSRVHLAGSPRLQEETALLSRLAEALGPDTRLAPFAPGQVSHRRWDGRAQLPGPAGGAATLTVLHLADAEAVERVLGCPEEAPPWEGPGRVLAELCRWLPVPCPARSVRLLALGVGGALKTCTSCPPLTARTVSGVARELDRLCQGLELRRGCAQCPVAESCSRCPFTGPLSEGEFCALRRRLGEGGVGARGWKALESERTVALGWDD